MGAQMNIKNQEAVELAAELAEAEGVSRTQIVLEALRTMKQKREVEREAKIQRILQYCRETRAMMSPETLALDINEFLYDEYGMPK